MGPARTAIGLALLALVALSVLVPRGGARPARAEDDLAQLGFFGFALLLTASFYYWTLRVVAVVLHARHQPSSERDRWGLAALFAIEVLGWTVDLVVRYRYTLTAVTSIAVSLYAASVCVTRGAAALRRRRAALTPPDTPR
jgi:hypothetical protein